MPPTLDRIRQLFGPRLEELAGARVAADIPLSERVLNSLLADSLRSPESRVASAVVQVGDAGELLVRLRLRKPAFAPAVVVRLRIEEQPALPRSAVLVFRWSLPGFGMLAPLVAPVLSLLQTGPPWIAVEGERLHVHIARALEERGLAELLEHVAALRVTTRPGAIVVSLVLQVNE